MLERARHARDRDARARWSTRPGPWVPDVAERVLRLQPSGHVRLVKGSHIVVRRLFEHDHAYIFQNADGRIVFAIPYERDFTLIGTTDEDFDGDLAAPAASAAEIDYLCGAVSDYFRKPRHARPGGACLFAGVRQLYDDGARSAQDLTREYVLELDGAAARRRCSPSIGGKITTYRRLAEAALEQARAVPSQLGATLDRAMRRCPAATSRMTASRRWSRGHAGCGRSSTEPHARRLIRAYGTRLDRILGDARNARRSRRALRRRPDRGGGALPDAP